MCKLIFQIVLNLVLSALHYYDFVVVFVARSVEYPVLTLAELVEPTLMTRLESVLPALPSMTL